MQKGYDMSQSQTDAEYGWALIPRWVLRSGYFESDAQKLLYIILADQRDIYGYCHPSLSQPAHDAVCTSKTLLENLQGLEKAGLIKHRRRISEDGSKLYNEYYVSLDCPIEQKGYVI